MSTWPPHVGAEPDALVFTCADGQPMRRCKFPPYWTQACAKAGMSELHFHDLRGSGATWAARWRNRGRADGASRAQTEHMAIRYQHATLERDQAIAKRLDVLMRAAQTASEPAAEVSEITIARRLHGICE